jgi:putative ABC transport system permease protein
MIRRPTFRRLALRNINRRRGEAALVIVGALLGTAIITASFVVGDTIEGSIRDAARTDLGPVDESVRLTDPAVFDRVKQAVTDPPIAGVDGTLRIQSAGAVVANTAADKVAVPAAGMIELDFDQARRFGGDPAATGLADAGATPSGTEVVVGDRLARKLSVKAGDPVEVFAYGTSKRFTVRQVVEDIGLVGYGPVRGSQGGAPTRPLAVFVPPGTIDAFAASGQGQSAAPPLTELVVSNTGGVFDGADRTPAVADALTARVQGINGVQVAKLKSDLLDAAKAAGDSFTQLFSGIGYFSVIAGVLLLVNLFVMLSEERKSELGMLRALGFKRNHLVRTFAIEGGVYSVIAAVLGALAAIGVSWVIILVAANIFNRGDSDLSFPLVVKPASLITGASLGLVISLLTVWGTSARITRLNIIRAIRDLQEPTQARQRLISLVLGLVGVAVGALMFASGWSKSNALAVLAGPAIVGFCLIPVLGRFLPRKLVTVVMSFLVLVWGIGVFTFASNKVGRAGIQVFVVQGIVLVAAGVTLLAQADRVWAGVAKGLSASGRGLAARLGLAYPLDRKFRTSLLLGMYSIVIFTMTFISVLSGIFGNQAPQFTEEIRSGYDVYVDSNAGNPVTVDQLKAVPGVADVAPLTRGAAQAITPKKPEGSTVGITGFDKSLIDRSTPKLDSRLPGYASDADAFKAVLADPNLIIVSSSFGSRNQGGGPPQTNFVVGDKVTLQNQASGAKQELTVAGILSTDFIGTGAWVGQDFAKSFLAPRTVQNRHYVRVAAGADADQVAASINGALIQNGASARSFSSRVTELLASQLAIFSLLRGYLGLGLVIGIAGLGVVMIRAVRERRREIGMLRAMGFSSATVRRSVMLEAAFISLQGIVLGVGLGMVTSYNLLVNSDAFGGQRLDFSWPWAVLAAIAIIPLFFSLLATAWPATQAARIKPAVALRIAD